MFHFEDRLLVLDSGLKYGITSSREGSTPLLRELAEAGHVLLSLVSPKHQVPNPGWRQLKVKSGAVHSVIEMCGGGQCWMLIAL
eukprot:6498303-Ditylum_brightwellii.AAC.1